MGSPQFRTSLREMLAELWRGVRCRRLPPHLRCWQVQGGVEPAEKAEEEKVVVTAETVMGMETAFGLDCVECSRRLDATLPSGCRS